MAFVVMAGTGAGNAAVKKMVDFIEGGAEGNELSEGLRNRLLTVSQSVSVDSIPSPINKTLTGRREGPATYSRANDGEHWTDSK